MRGIKGTQKFKLGDAQGTPRLYFKKSQAFKLGDAPWASHLSSSTTIG